MWQVAGPLEEKMRAANDAVDQKLSTLTKPFEEERGARGARTAPGQHPPFSPSRAAAPLLAAALLPRLTPGWRTACLLCGR